MRAAAKVGERSFRVERDVLVGRNRRDDFRLVVLAERLEVLHCVVARHDLARNRLVFLGELGHFLLDGDEVFGGERPLVREVVIETVFDHRADRHLRVGKEFLHRVREQMRGGMTQQVQTFGIAVGDDRNT